MKRRQNALLSGCFHLEQSLSNFLEQNPDILNPQDAKKLRTVVLCITKLVPSAKRLAEVRQAQINAEETQVRTEL